MSGYAPYVLTFQSCEVHKLDNRWCVGNYHFTGSFYQPSPKKTFTISRLFIKHLIFIFTRQQCHRKVKHSTPTVWPWRALCCRNRRNSRYKFDYLIKWRLLWQVLVSLACNRRPFTASKQHPNSGQGNQLSCKKGWHSKFVSRSTIRAAWLGWPLNLTFNAFVAFSTYQYAHKIFPYRSSS